MSGPKKLRVLLRTGCLSWITLFYFAFFPQFEIEAQEIKKSEEFYPLESVPQVGVDPLEGPLHQLLREELLTESQSLEGAIDPEEYRLGPGDLIVVYVMGEVEDQILARIGADGILRLRSLGIFDTRGKYLADIKKEIIDTASNRYQAGTVTISLLELRNFKASVGGMVWAPGTYNMTGADRVVSILARAGGFYNPTRRQEQEEQSKVKSVAEMVEEEEEKISKLPSYSARRAQLIHKDGVKENVDLMLFLRAGLHKGNPYLQDGDFLLIPPLNPNTGVVGIYGAVNHQGIIEHLQGDDLETVLLLAGGTTQGAQRDSVEITRFIGSEAAFHTIFIDLNDPEVLRNEIFPDDRIYIRSIPNYHPRHQVLQFLILSTKRGELP